MKVWGELEQALRESEARFRDLTELSADFYWEQDEQFRFVRRTSTAWEKRSYPETPTIGKTRWELPALNMTEADWANHRADLEAHREFRDLEIERPLPTGESRWISTSGRPTFDAEGRFRGYRGIGRDITERKLAEEREQRFRAAIDASLDSIYLTDLDTLRFVDVNESACRRTGYAREKLLTMGPHDLLEAPRDALRRQFEDVIGAGEQGVHTEQVFVTSDGSRRWTELHRRAVMVKGRWIVVTVGRDITDRRNAELALQKSEARLRLVADNVPAMLAEFGPDLRYRYVNCRYAEFFGAVPEAFEGRTVQEVIGEPAWEDLAPVLALAREGQSQSVERRARRPTDGSMRNLVIDLVPHRGASGAVESIYGMVLDETRRLRAERRLLEGEARMRLVLDHVPAMIAFVDAEFRYRYANRPYLAFYAGERTIEGETVRSVVGEEAWTFIGPNMQRAIGGMPVSYVRRFTRAEGPLEVEVTLVPNLDSQGRGTGVHILALDVTQRRRAEEALRLRNRAIESSVNWIMITELVGAQQRIVYVNPAFEQITGYASGEVFGRNPALLHSDDGEQQGVIALREAAEHKREAAVLVRNYRKDGSMFWNELRVAPVPDESGSVTHFVGVGTDVTERIRVQEQIERNANYDSLTGLPNRNLLADRLAQARIQAERSQGMLAVMFIDLDHLKRINDGLGHAVGDRVIAAVGARIAEALRAGDTVARLSGDEFVALLPNLKRIDDASGVAEKILAAIGKPLKVNGYEFVPTASAGIALYPKDAHEEEALMRGADAALYRAKEDGRDCFRFFSAELNASLERFLAVERSLRAAVEEEAFVLEYQPIVEIVSGETVGVEALIRWRSPEGRLVPPAEFIPVAEESGLIVPIGRWVIAAAARQAAAWRHSLVKPVYVSVNLSARQFRDPGLLGTIERAIRQAGMDATLLKFEITESTVMRDPDKATELLRALKELGVRISVDDFGTGYSSLAYLKRYPIDVLKIDRSFVRGLPGDSEDLALCGAVIDLARALGLEVVAEGIETSEQAQVLARRGCRFAQGYLFGRPAPADQLPLVSR